MVALIAHPIIRAVKDLVWTYTINGDPGMDSLRVCLTDARPGCPQSGSKSSHAQLE